MEHTQSFSCATLQFNEAKAVHVESAFVRALPGFSIVGMANQSIQESKERIKSALTSIGFKFPAQKITVSMAPSDLKKEGSHFDLGIALLLFFQKSGFKNSDFYIFGELGLDGTVRNTVSIFPIILSLAAQSESLRVLIPHELVQKVSQIPNVKAFGVKNIQEAVEYFENPENLKEDVGNVDLPFTSVQISGVKYFYEKNFALDFADIKGQSRLKRAMSIAATGMHNILLEGSPGCGKSMAIKRLSSILPPMSTEEILQTNAHTCISGIDTPLSAKRVFRSPHHTSSKASIFGGGSSAQAMAGECALAHNGLLFFDEFPHFSKTVLESLREPLEDNVMLVSRVNAKIRYDTKFLFAAAQNPCPCGNLLSLKKACRCNEAEIKRYKNRLSEPLLDRIDIYLQVLEEDASAETEDSSVLFEQVLKGFIFQKQRGQKEFNAKLSEEELERFAALSLEAKEVLQNARVNLSLSQRSIFKATSLARSIADMDESEQILKVHMLEALGYRRRE